MESGANAGNLKAVESAGKFATGLTFAPHWLKSEQRRCDWLEHVSYPKQLRNFPRLLLVTCFAAFSSVQGFSHPVLSFNCLLPSFPSTSSH